MVAIRANAVDSVAVRAGKQFGIAQAVFRPEPRRELCSCHIGFGAYAIGGLSGELPDVGRHRVAHDAVSPASRPRLLMGRNTRLNPRARH
jgi:hypothetical protein